MPMTFGLLGLAICTVWLAPVRFGRQISVPPWLLPFSAAIVAGLAEGYLAWIAVFWLGVFGALVFATVRSETARRFRLLSGAATLGLALALALHRLPGFNNPLLAANIRLSADAIPFSQYANFDKGAVGLILLALLATRCANISEWRNMLRRTFPILIATVAIVLTAATLAGVIKPDLKFTSLSLFVPAFLAINLLFTCVAEEAFFRGFLQDRLSRSLAQARYGESIAVVCSALLFGAAHLGGGIFYAGIAALAGLGYAYSYAVTKRIEAPILVHFSLNAIHFVGFTYPRLVQ